MSSPALQRLESLLQNRKLTHTLGGALIRRPERLSTGIPALDAALHGGWPCGEISELIGRRSSGRTSVLLSTMAEVTRRGGLVGLVDTFDRFDLRSAARAGVEFDRVLWVRGQAQSPRPDLLWPAIRALDLIVRAGGFALAVLDLADVPSRVLRGIPVTTWLRLAHANEARDTACLLIADAPTGRSARGGVLSLETRRTWTGTAAQCRKFSGFDLGSSIDVLLPGRSRRTTER